MTRGSGVGKLQPLLENTNEKYNNLVTWLGQIDLLDLKLKAYVT